MWIAVLKQHRYMYVPYSAVPFEQVDCNHVQTAYAAEKRKKNALIYDECLSAN